MGSCTGAGCRSNLLIGDCNAPGQVAGDRAGCRGDRVFRSGARCESDNRGHLGLPGQPAVFRSLNLLRAGDEVHVIWPDGRTLDFRVTSSETVDANAHPAGLFARSGAARLSLITCAGEWVNALATYTDRLI